MEWTVDRLIGIVGIGTAIILAAIALGVALGMDTKTQGELRFVQCCFVFSAIALFLPLIFWGIESQARWAIKLTSAAILSALIGTILLGGLRWVTNRHLSVAPSSSSPNDTGQIVRDRSYLVIRLVIDEADKTFMQFHFVLKNDGRQEIKISHLMYKNLAETSWEGSMEPVRTIVPNGELVCNGRINRSDVPGDLNVLTSYTTAGSKAVMTANFGFRIRTIDLRQGNILDPTSREETVGEKLVPSQIILDGLRQRVGSLIFWFPENLPDGSPTNLLVSADPTRRISFDPQSRTVHLTMLSNGNLFQLERPLREPKQGMHFVAATWDDVGNVHLYVDGKE